MTCKNPHFSFYSPINVGSVSLKGNIFLAPIAGYSDAVFRSLCEEEGAALTYTEMVSSEALVRDVKKTCDLIEKTSINSQYAIQLFGSSSQRLKEATKIVVEKYEPSIVDINAGCPMPKITKQGAGSALLSNPILLYQILSTLVETLAPHHVPLSLKIRSGKTNSAPLWKEVAKVAVDAGVAAITMHPRSEVQCYSGISDVMLIGELKEYLRSYDVKVFGSGDLFSPEDAKNMFEKTLCDGIMFARGAIGNPFIFRQTKDLLEKGSYQKTSIKEKIDMAKKELRLLSSFKGEKLACLEMRKRSVPYIKGIVGASSIKSKLVRASKVSEYEEILDSILDSIHSKLDF